MGSSSQSEDHDAVGVVVDSKQMGMPTWLNSALSRQQPQHHQQPNRQDQPGQQQSWPNPVNPSQSSYSNWLSGRGLAPQEHTATAELLLEQDRKASNSSSAAAAANILDHHQHHQEHQVHHGGGPVEDVTIASGSAAAGDLEECARYQNAGLKADIVTHPLYEQLLESHVACLRIATPVDQLSRIDGQISQCHQVMAKYSILANHQLLCGSSKEELDHFMAHYVMLLKSFKEQLQHHVRVHAKDAVMACWELEQSLISLTGAAPGEGTGATMSDDEEEQQSDQSDYWQDNLGFGPLIPTETERTLMERVRQELKHELKQGYRARIVDVREEILRKRRAGKLPGDTTSVLKAWWHAHSKWPYPTEDEKARLVQETGLELKQINNWFINQRKRNWHHHPSSSTSTSKSKCKS